MKNPDNYAVTGATLTVFESSVLDISLEWSNSLKSFTLFEEKQFF